MTARRSPPRRRRRYLNRGTTPLWIADPPSALGQDLYRKARTVVRWTGQSHHDPLAIQPWLRKVSAVFHQLLREERIYVEGA
ncbi:MAG TPA: hypothetical protein VFQ42_21875 [Mycobacterium sp.]|nr:hypothetical protein [Mycobacterium sp.]